MTVRLMTLNDVAGVVALQPLAFPQPFDPDLHWEASHIERHLEIFPEAQFVAEVDGEIVGSCSNTRIGEAAWRAHGSWVETVGGPYLENLDLSGSTLYGLDISVHPEFRRRGLGRAFYQARYDFVAGHGLARYGTACRLPDFRNSGYANVRSFADAVVDGRATDRTLTPLLRMGLAYRGVIENYMEDAESGDAAALLEWTPQH